jgi:hypothetical protein
VLVDALAGPRAGVLQDERPGASGVRPSVAPARRRPSASRAARI